MRISDWSSDVCSSDLPMISGTRYRLTAEINRQSDLAREIARAQMEISTQKRILNPSDDPIGAARVAEIDRTQANEEAWRRNVATSAGRGLGRASGRGSGCTEG